MQELGVFAESCFYAGFVGVLDFDLPLLVDHPACDKVVIVGVERSDETEEDVFVLEAMLEIWIL